MGLIENGSWAPIAGKIMRETMEGMKEISILEPVVSIKSTLNEESETQLRKLAEALVK